MQFARAVSAGNCSVPWASRDPLEGQAVPTPGHLRNELSSCDDRKHPHLEQPARGDSMCSRVHLPSYHGAKARRAALTIKICPLPTYFISPSSRPHVMSGLLGVSPIRNPSSGPLPPKPLPSVPLSVLASSPLPWLIITEDSRPSTPLPPMCQGPEGQGRLYADDVFRAKIDFSENYPLDPPDVVFLAPAPVHPHIYR